MTSTELDTEVKDSERGSAVIEFLALAVLLLIPAVWFLVAVAQIQAANYAAVGAADQAAKMYATGSADAQTRAQRSEAAIHMALADFDIDPDQAHISRFCPENCEDPGAVVGFTVEVNVPLPLVPEFGSGDYRIITVSSTAAQVRQP